MSFREQKWLGRHQHKNYYVLKTKIDSIGERKCKCKIWILKENMIQGMKYFLFKKQELLPSSVYWKGKKWPTQVWHVKLVPKIQAVLHRLDHFLLKRTWGSLEKNVVQVWDRKHARYLKYLVIQHSHESIKNYSFQKTSRAKLKSLPWAKMI